MRIKKIDRIEELRYNTYTSSDSILLYQEDEKGGPTTTTAGSKDKTYVEVLLGVFHTNQSRESAEEDDKRKGILNVYLVVSTTIILYRYNVYTLLQQKQDQ